MDNPPSVPLVFANRVIRQFADHLLGADLVIEPKDFMILRLTFRKCGGQWLSVVQGDIRHTVLLEKVVTAWGKRPERKRDKGDA